MSARTPRFWSLTTLVGAALAVTGATAAAVLVTAGDATPSEDPQSQIIAASEVYLQALATADLPALTQVVCASTMQTFPGFADSSAPKALLGVTDLSIAGDSASGAMLISDTTRPEIEPTLIPMKYVNEDGWKLCV